MILTNSRWAAGFDGDSSLPYDENSVVDRESLVVSRHYIASSISAQTVAPHPNDYRLPTIYGLMRIAYLDCFSGISGDMFLGALLDAGVSAQLLHDTVKTLDIGASLEIKQVSRAGISASKVDVYVHGKKDQPRDLAPEPANETGKDHHHSHQHPHQHGRALSEIRRVIEQSAISSRAKATAIRIFETLGEAEAKIHNTSIEQVHFHEVGAADAMVDIICAAVGAESLAIEEWVCSPLNVGGGTVKCAHATLPVPAPATLLLLQHAPVYSSGPQVELVTPTGAAIVKTLVTRFAPFPSMKIEKAGYGAGTRDFPDHPNLLRLTLGEPTTREADTVSTSNDRITVLEANLDDLSPQVLAYAMERLLAEGALDVFSVPVQMKKNRPGALLTVLAKMEDANRLTKTIFAETTTLGVRIRVEERQILSLQ
jgi:pyridinium-3,5-bisthiocarboxylic acid mononucleotide nickel chelatase